MKHYILFSVHLLEEDGSPVREDMFMKFRTWIELSKTANKHNGPRTEIGNIIKEGELSDNVWLLPDNTETKAFEAELCAAAKKYGLKLDRRYLEQSE